MKSNPMVEVIWLAEFSDYAWKEKVDLPDSIKVMRMTKVLITSEHMEFNGRDMLMPEDSIDFQTVSIDGLDTFYYKWNLTLIDYDLSTHSTEHFWPSVPEGYRYQDKREWTSAISSKAFHSRTEVEKKSLRGEGPYTFPQIYSAYNN